MDSDWAAGIQVVLTSSLTPAPWLLVNLEELLTLSSFVCELTWAYDTRFHHALFD